MKIKPKTLLLTVLILAVLIQLYPVDRTNPPVLEEVPAPPEVAEVFESACYNCHSNQVRWPWYSYVAPVSWLIAHDVSEAREHLNFSEWGLDPEEDMEDLLEEIWEEVEEGEMPLKKYRLLHPEARLTERQKGLIEDWTSEAASRLEESDG